MHRSLGSSQNESAKYNLAHPFSHDRSFIPMFLRW